MPRLPPALANLGAGALSGSLLLLAFPPLDVRWVALLALVPLLLVLRGASWWRGALAGLGFGWAFFGILLYWISAFGFVAWTGLTLILAAYVALFGALGALASRGSLLGRLIAVPLLWVGVEMMRGRMPMGGFSWGEIGYSQIGAAMQSIARIGGVHLLSLAVVAVNVLIAELLVAGERRERLRLAVAGAAIVIALPVFLPVGLAGAQTGSLDVAAVQGNVPRGLFTGIGRGRTGPEDDVIVRNHIRVTEQLLGTPVPDLIVWPENAFDRDPRTNPALFEPVQEVVRRVGAPTVLGAIMDEADRFANANLLLDADGEIIGRYDKVHLVPFGEYVPLGFARDLVPALDREIPRDGRPGARVETFAVDGARIGTLICFESTFPELARASVRDGAQVLVVTTNNASYGTSPASAQHLAMSRMRAVEHGLPVVHAAISGISAIVAPDGSIVARAGLFTPALLREQIPLSDGSTPYTRYGSWLEMMIGVGAAAAAVGGVVAAARSRGRPEEEA